MLWELIRRSRRPGLLGERKSKPDADRKPKPKACFGGSKELLPRPRKRIASLGRGGPTSGEAPKVLRQLRTRRACLEGVTLLLQNRRSRRPGLLGERKSKPDADRKPKPKACFGGSKELLPRPRKRIASLGRGGPTSGEAPKVLRQLRTRRACLEGVTLLLQKPPKDLQVRVGAQL